jgi:glycosyltransferase involved in cell wall biosynthesis
MEGMKTLLITRDKDLFAEGSEAFKELLECAKRVEEIHVIVPTLKDEGFSFRKISISEPMSAPAATIFLYPTNSNLPILYIQDTMALVRSQLTLKFHLIADLISAEGGFLTSFCAYLISWKYGKNFIINLHQSLDDMAARDNVFVKALKFDALDFLLKHASGIRVSSQGIGEEIYSRFPDMAGKIFILPFISDIEHIRDAWTRVDIRRKFKRFNIILLYAAREIAFDSVINAEYVMHVLRRRYPRIGLVVVGRIRHNLINLPRRMLLPDNIVFGKRISDMTSYYRTANVFIDTSYVSTHVPAHILTQHELYNPEITNAALAGIPIVTGKNEISDDIVRDGENGFIANPVDSRLFAKKIMDILEKDGLREEMRFARFNISEVYGKSLDGYADRLTGIWESCKSIVERNAHIDKPAKFLTHERAAKSRAITMFVAEQVKQKLARAEFFPTISPSLRPTEGENAYVLDLDKIRSTIEEVEREAEKQPDKASSDGVEIIDLEKDGFVDLR